MNIKDKIKQLQKVQIKIDLYEKLSVNLKNELNAADAEVFEDTEVLREFINEVTVWLKSRIDQLNGSGEDSPKNEPRPPAAKPVTHAEKPKRNPPILEEDPLRFALRWNKNEGKKVQFTTKDGVITGLIRGVNPPNNVVVEIEHNGITVAVPQDELTILTGEAK